MTSEITYLDYVRDAEHMRAYEQYQARYSTTVRESDRVLLDTVARLASERDGPVSLLDLGCSTGNLLLHLKRLHPELELTGGDIVAEIIEGCRSNPELEGIDFAEMDMLALDQDARFDLVVTNAALMFFTEEELRQALHSLGGVVKPDGFLVAFDFFHPFEQEVAIVERSRSFPEGLKFHFRSYRLIREALADAGFEEPELRPFEIPIDLPRPGDLADITSWTERSADGRGMSFRGTIFQPWCHLTARRSA
jgi:SAM-dependent methyltransferase